MYQSFYGLNDKPFSMLPDPAFLYLGKKHQSALTLLEYGLYNNAGFCVISGETGAGKTTLLRQLLNEVGEDVVVGMITNTHQSFGSLLDWVLSAFNIHQPNMDRVEQHQMFVDFLLEQYAHGKTVLLIVDEAQNMSAETLEELRMLSNINSEKDQVLQVILAGQPELKQTLQDPKLRQFAQRISVDYHLDPLSIEETCGYIQHRLWRSGATEDIFTADACARIHTYSGGIPRLINLICDTVLVYGFADQDKIIDRALIDEMVLERMQNSVVPILNLDHIDEIRDAEPETLNFEFPSIASLNGEESEDGVEVAAEEGVDTGEGAMTPHAAEVDVEEAETEEQHVVAAQDHQSGSETHAAEGARGEPLSELAEKMHLLENEVHGLEEEVQVLEGEVHDKELQLLHKDVEKPNLLIARGGYILAGIAFLILAVFILFSGEDKAPPAVDVSQESAEVKRMLTEMERARQEIEALRAKEAQRVLEEARQRAAQLELESKRSLEMARQEEERLAEEKRRALQEIKIANEKAKRAEERMDELFKQRQLEEQRRQNELLAREQELERQREELKRAEIQKALELEKQKALELEKKVKAGQSLGTEQGEESSNELGKAASNEGSGDSPDEKSEAKSFVTDPCSSSSARFLSTCR